MKAKSLATTGDFTPLDLRYHLESSVDRVMIAPLGLFALSAAGALAAARPQAAPAEAVQDLARAAPWCGGRGQGARARGAARGRR